MSIYPIQIVAKKVFGVFKEKNYFIYANCNCSICLLEFIKLLEDKERVYMAFLSYKVILAQ